MEQSDAVVPKRLKLRPLTSVPQEELTSIIKQNLLPLKSQKKKFAQDKYYETNSFQSPLTAQRPPVHERLGQRKPKVFHLGTNTSNILPKSKPFSNLYNRQGQQKRTRHYSAQMRLNKIRNNNQLQINGSSKTVKLRRNMPAQLTVQVQNPGWTPRSGRAQTNRITRFRMILNPQVQQEIAILEQTCRRGEYENDEIATPTVVTTEYSLTERFANLK